jgi:transposase
VEFAHADTTAFSLQGEYEFDEDPLADDGEGQPITVTYGHSKDHRPDLKQAILSLICAHQSRIPVYLKRCRAIPPTKVSVPETVQAYVEQLGMRNCRSWWPTVRSTAPIPSRICRHLKWVTRVPATLTEVKTLLADIDRRR